MDGARLLRMNEKALIEFGLTDMATRRSLISKIQHLREVGKVRTDEWTTEHERKLIDLGVKKLEKLKGLSNLSEEQKREKAKVFVLKEYLLETYLNQEFVATKRTLTELLEEPSTLDSGAASDGSHIDTSGHKFLMENPATTSGTTNAAAAFIGASTASDQPHGSGATTTSTGGGATTTSTTTTSTTGASSQLLPFASVGESHQEVMMNHQQHRATPQESSNQEAEKEAEKEETTVENDDNDEPPVDEKWLAQQTKQDTNNLLRMKQELEAIQQCEAQMAEMRRKQQGSGGMGGSMGGGGGTSMMTVKNEEYMKVKLVIVEIHQNASQRTFRKVLSPIMDAFDIAPTFGLFHSALIVGPWYLEWNDSGFIVPRKCYSGAAVLAADVPTQFKGREQVKDALDKMAELICHWNANYQYSQNQKNCQAFVDELCEVLGIELNFKGALNDYLVQLRKNGKCDLKFFLSDAMRELLGTEDKYKTFETHQQLDDFVKSVMDKNSCFFDQSPDDWMLLKSFDRAFWLRWYKNKSDERWSPREVDDRGYMTSCPFDHPNNTQTMVDNFFTYKS